MSEKIILYTEKNNLAYITINRPEKLNALNKAVIFEINKALQTAEANSEIRCVLITGSGEKAFVAGADIAEFSDFNASEGAALAKQGQELVFSRIENFSKPIIAAINGYALGGGLELSMACHIRVATTTAKMGLPEVTLGLIPGYGGTQRLAQLIGKGKAMELILSATMISAEEALNLKLVNHVCSPEDLLSFCEKLTATIARNSPNAIKNAINAINAGYNSSDGFKKEIANFGQCFGTPDFLEGTSAFLEKRKPRF